jgi:vancomycin resistance protein VanJ
MNHWQKYFSKQSLVLAARIYLAIIICWQIAIRIGLQEFWIVRFIDTFGAWLYLPLAGLLPCLFYKQIRKQLIGTLLVPLLIFGWEYHWCLLPKVDNSSTTGFKVMTWNIRYDNPNPKEIANVINSEQPDVVAVQELMRDTAWELSTILKPAFPYQYINPLTFEFGFFSKQPIKYTFNPTVTQFQEANIAIGNREITLINVHLPTPAIKARKIGFVPIPIDYNTNKQDEIYPALIDRVRAIEKPLLVVGDFNTGDRDRNYKLFSKYLTNAFEQTGWGLGFTYPIKPLFQLPLVRIDHIFYSQHWQANAARTNKGSGSDHQYLVAKLQLK